MTMKTPSPVNWLVGIGISLAILGGATFQSFSWITGTILIVGGLGLLGLAVSVSKLK